MCGISGFIDFNKRDSSNSNTLTSMTDVIAHRGPDDSGAFVQSYSHSIIGLGQRRLSILDLSPLGHQPYHYNNLIMVFNGEIYNFKEVREKLKTKGYSFISNSDTEVIIKAYEAYGITCINEFIGMFSFALLDQTKEKFYLVRDRAGVKPMNYYWNENLLLFGSELKSFHQHPAFKKTLDYDSVALYFQYSYIPGPYTIFHNTHKLKPGHYLEIDLKTKEQKLTSYWNVLDYYNKPKLQLSFEEAEQELESLFKSAFNYRMVSDVPVGVFLSGGYDSSLVASILQSESSQRLKTFTIGFDDPTFNEAPFAKKVADHLGTDHTEYYCTHKEAFDIIPTLADIYDEPFGDNSIIPTTLVSKVAVKQVKVALSADGGDEIFAGYPRYSSALKFTESMPAFLQTALSKGMSLINPDYIPGTRNSFNFSTRFHKMREMWAGHDPATAMKIIVQFNTDRELQAKLKHAYNKRKTDFDLGALINNHNDSMNRMLAIDYRTFLVDNNLNKVDKATMSVSLEGREPLLDHRITEFAAQLPSSFKYKDKKTKVILKSIVHKYVPREIMERPKMGFVVPLVSWFQKELKDLVMENINEKTLNQDNLFNTKEMLMMRDRFLKGEGENIQKLWHLLNFQMWKKRWM